MSTKHFVAGETVALAQELDSASEMSTCSEFHSLVEKSFVVDVYKETSQVPALDVSFTATR